MPIGIHPRDMNPFTCHEIKIQKDDVFYLFSDGFADQLNGLTKRKYMKGKFKKFLISIHKKPITEQKRMIRNEFFNWKGDFDQIDDVLVLGFKCS